MTQRHIVRKPPGAQFAKQKQSSHSCDTLSGHAGDINRDLQVEPNQRQHLRQLLHLPCRLLSQRKMNMLSKNNSPSTKPIQLKCMYSELSNSGRASSTTNTAPGLRQHPYSDCGQCESRCNPNRRHFKQWTYSSAMAVSCHLGKSCQQACFCSATRLRIETLSTGK